MKMRQAAFMHPDPSSLTPSYQSTLSRWRNAPKLTNLIVRLIFVRMVSPENPIFRRAGFRCRQLTL